MIIPFKLFQDTDVQQVEKAVRLKIMADQTMADKWVSYTLFTGDIMGFVALMETDHYQSCKHAEHVVQALARFAFQPVHKFVAVGPNRKLRLVAANDGEPNV